MEYSSVSLTPTAFAEPLSSESSEELVTPSESGVEYQHLSTLAPIAVVEPADAPRQPMLQVFISTFFTIFLAELGDKTQVTTLLMSAESHAPWIVFAGAGTALIATSLLGVWLGCWLAQRVSPRTLEIAAGCLLLLVAAQLIWDVIHL